MNTAFQKKSEYTDSLESEKFRKIKSRISLLEKTIIESDISLESLVEKLLKIMEDTNTSNRKEIELLNEKIEKMSEKQKEFDLLINNHAQIIREQADALDSIGAGLATIGIDINIIKNDCQPLIKRLTDLENKNNQATKLDFRDTQN